MLLNASLPSDGAKKESRADLVEYIVVEVKDMFVTSRTDDDPCG